MSLAFGHMILLYWIKMHIPDVSCYPSDSSFFLGYSTTHTDQNTNKSYIPELLTPPNNRRFSRNTRRERRNTTNSSLTFKSRCNSSKKIRFVRFYKLKGWKAWWFTSMNPLDTIFKLTDFWKSCIHCQRIWFSFPIMWHLTEGHFASWIW
mgnify:FL=1